MKLNYMNICLLVILACGAVIAQNEEELHIPVENDNQFPPENPSEINQNVIEGSGGEPVEESDNNTDSALPNLEEIEPKIEQSLIIANDLSSTEFPCPKPCVCNIEGGSEDFVVDCSGYELSEFPRPLDKKTTILNIQNNKLTTLPIELSELKNLKKLYANNNLLMDLEPGSVSELPELVDLNLSDNRLVDYPKDLKNGFGLTKLQTLDLGGNDMRTTLSAETFSIFTSLQQLTLPNTTPELLDGLCTSLKNSLETICTATCKEDYFDCPGAPQNLGDELIVPIAKTAFKSVLPDVDPIPIDSTTVKQESSSEEPIIKDITEPSINQESIKTQESNIDQNDNLEAPEKVSKSSAIVETPGKIDDGEVKVGATTSDSKGGGVDKSIIGIIVAAMVVVVAAITIKKNWSAIKKRFSSNPRPANERNGGTTNGTVPEEVPLQEKSPV